MIENTLFRREKEADADVIQYFKDAIKGSNNTIELLLLLYEMEDRGYYIAGSRGYSYSPSQVVNATVKAFNKDWPAPTSYITRALGLRDKVEELLRDIKS